MFYLFIMYLSSSELSLLSKAHLYSNETLLIIFNCDFYFSLHHNSTLFHRKVYYFSIYHLVCAQLIHRTSQIKKQQQSIIRNDPTNQTAPLTSVDETVAFALLGF